VSKKVLILGGTGEAAELAKRLDFETSDAVEIITSFAGRTDNPPQLPGRVISGGFGGIRGLTDFIASERISLLIDATHPFAETVSDNAYIASTATNTQRTSLIRPEWSLPPDAKWVEVDDMQAASEAIGAFATRTFLTTGTRGLEAFSDHTEMWFLVRMIANPVDFIPLHNHHIITARPPHSLEAERRLLVEHRIDCLVSKHAGGEATVAKIITALEADIPIILIRRPIHPPGHCTGSVDECVDWVLHQL
jgi:precorrin-6A/cobalt-precorrin-6A reductase